MPTSQSKSTSVLFRLRHVKLAKAAMGLQGLIRDAADEIERLQTELAGYHAHERALNEALNSGDGSYRP